VTQVVNILLLSLVYFTGVLVVRLVFWTTGKHLLNLKGKKTSYWIANKDKNMTLEDARRMF